MASGLVEVAGIRRCEVGGTGTSRGAVGGGSDAPGRTGRTRLQVEARAGRACPSDQTGSARGSASGSSDWDPSPSTSGRRRGRQADVNPREPGSEVPLGRADRNERRWAAAGASHDNRRPSPIRSGRTGRAGAPEGLPAVTVCTGQFAPGSCGWRDGIEKQVMSEWRTESAHVGSG